MCIRDRARGRVSPARMSSAVTPYSAASAGSAAVDVVSDLLQGLEVGDVGDLIAGFLQQRLVHDDTVGLQAVAEDVYKRQEVKLK